MVSKIASKNKVEVDRQLQLVVNLLNDCDLHYWIDSGTLLGMIRNGKIFDNDLDISMIYDSQKVNALVNKLKKSGYKVGIRYYLGVPYSLDIKSTERTTSDIDLDLKFFRQYENYILSPTVYSLNSFRNEFSKAFHNTIKFPFSILLRIFHSSQIYSDFFHNLFSARAVWNVPIEHIKTLKRLPGTNINIPDNSRKYLEYRYGKDWMIPNSNWDYVKDDQSFILRDLKDFLKVKHIK